jgi:LPXTG-motif cell wall-anchored protein
MKGFHKVFSISVVILLTISLAVFALPTIPVQADSNLLRIDSVSPARGCRGASGLLVTVTGYNMSDFDSVDFGEGITATKYIAYSSYAVISIDIDSNATLGPRNVRVGGSHLDNGYLVTSTNPIIDSIGPNQWSQGATIMIGVRNDDNGLSLANTSSLDLEFGEGITVKELLPDPTHQDTDLYVEISIAADATPGPRDVTLNVAEVFPSKMGSFTVTGSTTVPNGFTVLPAATPTISSIDPTQGFQGASVYAVKIYGTNLSNTTALSFGDGIFVDGYSSIMTLSIFPILWFQDSDTELDATISIDSNATPGLRDITLTTTAGNVTLTGGFTVNNAPVVAPIMYNISPSSGPEAGGTHVTITGTHLSGATAVYFGTTLATINSTPIPTDSSLTATSPVGTGIVNVSVTTPGGTSATNQGTFFTYIVSPSVSQTWYLASTGNPVMEQTGSQSGSMDIAAGASTTWLSDQPATSDITFPSGTWTIKLATTSDWSNTCSAQVGDFSPTGSGTFTAFNTQPLNGIYNNGIITFTITIGGTVSNNDYLALRVFNGNGSSHSITTDGSSSLTAPSGSPSYPTPEMPAVVLLGVGLVGLSGFLFVRKKKAIQENIGQ